MLVFRVVSVVRALYNIVLQSNTSDDYTWHNANIKYYTKVQKCIYINNIIKKKMSTKNAQNYMPETK